MIRRTIAALAALLLVAPVTLSAQSYPPQPDPGATRAFRLPQTQSFTLPNGLEVTLVPYGVAPKTVISLQIDAGNLNEGNQVALADLAGEMLREGAAGRSSEQIAVAAAGMGDQLAINVGQDATTLQLNILSEHVADAVQLIADVATRPDLPAGEFDRVRQNLARSIAVARSQPQPVAEAVLARAYYGDHPYGRVLPAEEQLAAYTIDDVRRFHRDNFGARRARLYVAGRFDAAAVRGAIEQAFSGWAAGAEPLRLPPAPRTGPQVLLVDRPGAPQSTLRIAFPAPAPGTEGDVDMQVMNALLAGAFTSRITQNIREDKGYTYSPGASVSRHPGEARWTFQADVTTADTGAALREVFAEIRRLQTEAPPVEEARGMGTWLAGGFILANASPAGLIQSLASRDLYGLPANWLDTYVPAVLAVDAARISAAATRRLPLDRMTIVVVGDLGAVRPQLEALPELRDAGMRVADPI